MSTDDDKRSPDALIAEILADWASQPNVVRRHVKTIIDYHRAQQDRIRRIYDAQQAQKPPGTLLS